MLRNNVIIAYLRAANNGWSRFSITRAPASLSPRILNLINMATEFHKKQTCHENKAHL